MNAVLGDAAPRWSMLLRALQDWHHFVHAGTLTITSFEAAGFETRTVSAYCPVRVLTANRSALPWSVVKNMSLVATTFSSVPPQCARMIPSGE